MTQTYFFARHNPDLFRDIDCLGPVWQREEFFDNLQAPFVSRYGSLDTTKMQLSFRKGDRLPKPDFLTPLGILSCPASLYDYAFASVLNEQVVTFDFSIDDDAYRAFRPIHFFDLIDLETSNFRRSGQDGPIYLFNKIGLRFAPRSSVNIFSCSEPETAILDPILSERFVQIYDTLGLTGLEFRKCDIRNNT